MPAKLSNLPTYFLLMLFFSQSLAIITPQLVCDLTPFPALCSSILSKAKPGTLHDYGRFCMQQSLLDAIQSLSSIEEYLQRPSTTYLTTIHALEDCHSLVSLTMDYVTQAIGTINSTDTLDSYQTDDVETLLSAIITNQVTCLDGLKALEPSASSSLSDLLVYLGEVNQKNSVTLGLFKYGNWGPNLNIGRWLTERGHTFSSTKKGHPPATMSRRNRKVYGRKLLGTTVENLKVKVSAMVVVKPDGSGDFATINEAVTAAPNNTDKTDGHYMIYVTAGVYEEYVSVPKYKKFLMMVGDGINQTVITGNRSVVDGWTTLNSATFAVVGQGFVGVNMTIRNTAGAIKHQAVAVRNGADMSTFYKCSFEGYQDTLYAHSLRQFYRDCDIYGTVDFIFGNAAVVLQNCNLYPRIPMENQFNVMTAQGRTDPNQNTGISIHNCLIKPANDNDSTSYNSVKTYLGRPWKQYSRTVYMEAFIDSLVDPLGWTEWSGDFALSTLYYAEYNNRGPGSNTANRVTWPGYHVINATDAFNFTVSNFTGGDSWLPKTGVPYNKGLLSY